MAITKRNMAPRFWPVSVKEKKYVVTPVSGPHSKTECIPLLIVLRDFMKITRSIVETKTLLNTGTVKINGITRREIKFPLGLMDILEVDSDFYRVLPSKYGLKLAKVGDGTVRLAKIDNKTQVKGKKLQLNLHNGANMLADKGEFKTGDVVVIKNDAIESTLKFDKGSIAVVTDGNNRGLVGKIESIDKKLKTASLANDDGSFLVPLKYVFVVGHSKPEVSLGE